MTLFRDYDGCSVPVQRFAETAAAAERRLKEALRDRIVKAGGDDEITAESRVKELAEHWWAGFSTQDKSPGTFRLYRDRLDNQIIPSLGNLRVRELTTGAVDRHVRAVRERNGAAVAKAVRTVISNMCAHACRFDIMTSNPCREVAPVKPKTKNPPRALTLAEVGRMRVWFTYDDVAMRQELPDIFDAMLATGLRIAEVLAIEWSDIDFKAGTLKTGKVVVREKGKGLTVKTDPTSKINQRTLALPQWGIDLFKRRHENRKLTKCVWQPVFLSATGTLRDPNNVDRQFREFRERAGFDWFVPHHLRKTAATIMDKAGLSAREISDQLGHSKTSMTQDTYMGRGEVNPRAAKALEGLAPDLKFQ